MGCGDSKPKLIKAEKGVFIEKIDESKVKNTNVYIQEHVYLFGGAKILQFDTKQMRISQVKYDPSLKIPKRTTPEYLKDMKKIITVGGTVDGAITDACYLLDPMDFNKFVKLPNYPKPVKCVTLAYFNGVVWGIGGETNGGDPEGILKEVYCLKLQGGQASGGWELACSLDKPRRSANVAITEKNIYIWGGYNGKGLRTTQIETIDLGSKAVTVQQYRLPLGVEGARLCWYGDDILLVGGKRIGDAPDANVLVLDLEKKAIMSKRDLGTPRDFPIIIPLSVSEVVVIGGAKLRTAEKRAWNPEVQDYEFNPVTIEGMDLLEDPSAYNAALPTFVNLIPDHDVFPEFATDSTIVFGNEIDCFLLEFPASGIPHFYLSPMRLQQKTGQSALRYDPNTIYLVGGTDTTRSKISQKTFKFSVKTKNIDELAKLNAPRYFAQFIHHGSDFYLIGGKSQGGIVTPNVEKLSIATEKEKWDQLPPMKHPRIGHVAWAADKKIFVIGGTEADRGKPIEEVEVYDTVSNEWKVLPFKMSPALSGCAKIETNDSILLFGGQDFRDLAQSTIFKINKSNPTAMENVGRMKVPRVDAFALKFNSNYIVVGGSNKSCIEGFGLDMKPLEGFEAKTESFFHQLSNFTSDMRLENCSFG